MAKITVTGNACVITSSLKFDEIEMLKKYEPDALVLKDEEGEPIFAISVTDSNGKVNKYGIEFDGTTRDDEKLATTTMVLAGNWNDETIKNDIADELGSAILNLQKLEDYIPTVVRQVRAERERILEHITIA